MIKIRAGTEASLKPIWKKLMSMGCTQRECETNMAMPNRYIHHTGTNYNIVMLETKQAHANRNFIHAADFGGDLACSKFASG